MWRSSTCLLETNRDYAVGPTLLPRRSRASPPWPPRSRGCGSQAVPAPAPVAPAAAGAAPPQTRRAFEFANYRDLPLGRDEAKFLREQTLVAGSERPQRGEMLLSRHGHVGLPSKRMTFAPIAPSPADSKAALLATSIGAARLGHHGGSTAQDLRALRTACVRQALDGRARVARQPRAYQPMAIDPSFRNRPLSSLAQDLGQAKVARYNFITPNLCNDMHGQFGCPCIDLIKPGDDWFAANIPALESFCNANDGVVFVKSVEKIFGLPILSAVTGANDFADVFKPGALP